MLLNIQLFFLWRFRRGRGFYVTNSTVKTNNSMVSIGYFLGGGTLSASGSRLFSVGYNGIRGVCGGRTKLTEVSGTGIEIVPNLTGVFIGLLSPQGTVLKTLAGDISSKKPWYT